MGGAGLGIELHCICVTMPLWLGIASVCACVLLPVPIPNWLRTGMRRAFSLEAIPSELMYHTLDSPAYQLEGCPGHAYQPSLGLPLVPGVGREAEFSNIAMPTNQEILQFQEVS